MKGDDPREILRKLKALQAQVGSIAGTVAVNWFKGNFSAQGFRQEGGALDKWKQRSPGARRNSGRNILVDTGRLRRSVRIVGKGASWVVVGTDLPYAEAHNSGLTKSGAAPVKAFQRRGRKGGLHRVAAHTRNININLPRRQFLGNSGGLNNGIAAEFVKRLRRMGF